jgi:hypothetical protein
MKRRVMQYVRQKGHTDSPLDVQWHVEIDLPSNGDLYS